MITLDQAYEAFAGRKEFVVKDTEDTISFDYIIIMDDSFNDEKYGHIRRNFRGITFCKKTGKILSLPFPKFFNINQNTESQYSLHKDKKAVVYEKVDGSMIHFYKKNDGELVASTCRSPESLQAKEALVFANTDRLLLHYIHESIDNGLTPMFEWCAPHNQIVVYYKQPRLIYLMSRYRNDGKYLFEEKYGDKVKKYDISFVDILNETNKTDFEGYVCHLEDGNVFKVKTKWYLERHRSVDLLTKPKYKIYEVALSGYLDDVISLSPENHKKTFMDVQKEVSLDLLDCKKQLEKEFENILKGLGDVNAEDHRKRFAMKVKGHNNFSEFMQMLSGKSPDNTIKKKLMSKYISLYPERVML